MTNHQFNVMGNTYDADDEPAFLTTGTQWCYDRIRSQWVKFQSLQETFDRHLVTPRPNGDPGTHPNGTFDWSINEFGVPSPEWVANKMPQQTFAEGFGPGITPSPPIEGIDPVPADPVGGAVMRWRGDYDGAQSYVPGAVVAQAGYLFNCVRKTSEIPVVLNGDPTWITEATGVFTDAPVAAQAEQTWITSQKFFWPQGGFLIGYRFKVPVASAEFTYELWAISEIPGVISNWQLILPATVYESTDWINVPAGFKLWVPGTAVTMALVCKAVTQPNTFTANWDVKNSNGNPSSGETWFQNNATQIRIHKTDKGNNDQSGNLEAVVADGVGGSVLFAGQEWTITGATDNGSHVRLDIAPTQGRPSEGERNLTFQWGSSTPLPYNRDDDFYSGTAEVSGAEGADLNNLTPTDHGYPLDLQLQPAITSEDWEFMAVAI